ncbi:hypothetical protein AGOR_G00129790 [Albula goreensis]|uniref:Fork-head domain-containing protein n=1 Tax=Albula goreensis TaxID=1534307 RepID=A0A8T3DCT4_9TELE|nr:hypothetical protein AGOR_G00129790 [Albula goreensis]
MSTEPLGLAASPGSSRTPPIPPQQDRSSAPEPQASMREGPNPCPVRDSAPHRPKGIAAERFRRHSTDGVVTDVQEGGRQGAGHFHPYRRQHTEGDTPRQPPPYPPPHPHPPVCFQGMDLPEPFQTAHTHADQGGQQRAWDPYRESLQPSRVRETQPRYPEGQSQMQNAYNSQHPLQQFPAGMFPPMGQSDCAFQCLSPQAPQDNMLHTLYPKPIYSYSILIFMALRSSKTGSLPVSEIYSFMTEHFPYFKTAPDGWKNSVRHNLSLNKCFEKVENRSGGGAGGGTGGGASRKGCLWALNPARVEKMQEELHKWRRKDPLSVQKSMARPATVPSSTAPATSATQGKICFPMGGPGFDPPPSFSLAQRGTPGYTFSPALQSPIPPPFLYSSPGVPHEAGSLEPPQTLHYSAALQAKHCIPRTMQEPLMEGELCNDIDTLNPTLTDLQLHGNLWEELRDDSLAPDCLQLMPPLSLLSSSPPPAPAAMQGPSCPVPGETGVSVLGDQGETPMPDLHITGLYSTAFANLDGVACYLPTTGNTPITLL